MVVYGTDAYSVVDDGMRLRREEASMAVPTDRDPESRNNLLPCHANAGAF